MLSSRVFWYGTTQSGLIFTLNYGLLAWLVTQGAENFLQLGNPETYDAEDWRGMVDYAWSHAIVSDETYKTIVESCDFKSNDTWSSEICSQGVDEVLKQYHEIDIYSLYTPVCIRDTAASVDQPMLQVMMKRTSSMVSDINITYAPYLRQSF